MLSYIRKIRDGAKDRGASAVEYGLMVAAIAAVIVAVVFGLGNLIHGAFQQTCASVDSSVNPATNTTADCTK
jgi:pilus assembly protein Flp/PilA